MEHNALLHKGVNMKSAKLSDLHRAFVHYDLEQHFGQQNFMGAAICAEENKADA